MTDLETAKYYAKRRLDKEQQMSKDMLRAYIYAFSRALSLTASSGVSPSYFAFSRHLQLDAKVNKVMDKLVADLYNIIERYAYDNLAFAKQKNNREDDLDIVGYINRPIRGSDLNGKLAEYGENAKLEYEAYIAAGLLLSKPTNAVLSEFQTYYDNPYGSPMVRDSWSEKGAKIAAIRLLTKGVSFGAGRYVSAFNSFSRAGRATTDYAFNYADNEFMRRNGALGYQVYRGSSFPCEACDSNTGFHYINDISLPVHGHCLCYATPVYVL